MAGFPEAVGEAGEEEAEARGDTPERLEGKDAEGRNPRFWRVGIVPQTQNGAPKQVRNGRPAVRRGLEPLLVDCGVTGDQLVRANDLGQAMDQLFDLLAGDRARELVVAHPGARP